MSVEPRSCLEGFRVGFEREGGIAEACIVYVVGGEGERERDRVG